MTMLLGQAKLIQLKNLQKKLLKFRFDYKKYVKINKVFFRPSEVDLLVADSSKIK